MYTRLPGLGGIKSLRKGWFSRLKSKYPIISVVAKSLPIRSRMVDPATSS